MPPADETRELEPTTQHRWEAALRSVRADALDCLQTTFALVADNAYGAGAHLELGRRWRFPVRGRDRVVGVQPSFQDRLDEAADLLGLHVSGPRGPFDGPALRSHLPSTRTLDVIADAFDLPWIPYAGHRHMPHSFLLEARDQDYLVVDAYLNDTQWGSARPGAWVMSAAAVDRAVSGGALAIRVDAGARHPQPDRESVLAANAARARTAAGDIERYVVLLRVGLDGSEAVERLVLDIWLLARERLLHSAWIGNHPASAEVAAQAAAWQRLATQSYLALRRALRGGRPHGALVDDLGRLLHADAALVARLAGTARADDGAADT